MELKKGQKVYYARILEPVGKFEVIDLKIRTIADTWFVGTEKRTNFAYLFGMDTINKDVFFDRNVALKLVLEAEANCKVKFTKEKDFEEDDDDEEEY